MAKREKAPNPNRINTGDPRTRQAFLGDADVKALVPVDGLSEEELKQMDQEIFGSSRVATHHVNRLLKESIHACEKIVGRVDSHTKMKIAQDYIFSAFLHPKIRRQFLKAAYENPLAAAKLGVAMMPKDINVEITQQQGVILVPMRMENTEDWEKKALAAVSGGEPIEVERLEPRVPSWDDIVAEGEKP